MSEEEAKVVDEVMTEAPMDIEPEFVAEEQSADQAAEQVAATNFYIRRAEQRAQEFKKLYDDLQTDFMHYRKRNADLVGKARTDGAREVLEDLLEVIDCFEVAGLTIKDRAVASGVALILKKMLEVMGRHEVYEIKETDVPFDPNFHEALLQIENPEKHGQVLVVLRKGYRKGETVLRPAKVGVGK
jgi:molecular chaperone GrpE